MPPDENDDGAHIEDDMPEEIETNTTIALLCCLRSRLIKFGCVLAPSIFFFVLYLFIPAASIVLLGLAFAPIALYFLSSIFLTCHITGRQNKRDQNNSKVAQKHLEAKNVQVAPGGDEASSLFPMFIHAARYNNVEYLKWCIKDGQHPDQSDQFGRTALHWGACFGHAAIVAFLLKAGATVDKQDEVRDGIDPL